MTLLYITNQICGAAGLERVLSIKTNLLTKNYDYNIHVITLNQGNADMFYEFNKKIKFHDIQTFTNKIWHLWTYLKGIRTIVNQIKPEIISVCDDGLKGFLLPILLKRPCPMVYERHVSKEIENKTDGFNLFKWLKNKITYKLMDFGGKQYDKFVVLTKGNLDEWSFKNTVVINNPLSFNINVPKSQLNKKVVLAVGRQSYQKGYDRLLKSWRLVSAKNSDWQLHIYGKKDETLQLNKLTNELKISNSVFFNDPVKNISDIYQQASIFVLSSRFEGFGMVLTEAMMHGLPCVSFDCPYGPSDIIDNNINGFLLKNGDVEAFANKINDLIMDKELRHTMGTKAILKSSDFSPNRIIMQWDELFNSLKLTA